MNDITYKVYYIQTQRDSQEVKKNLPFLNKKKLLPGEKHIKENINQNIILETH